MHLRIYLRNNFRNMNLAPNFIAVVYNSYEKLLAKNEENISPSTKLYWYNFLISIECVKNNFFLKQLFLLKVVCRLDIDWTIKKQTISNH